MSSTGRRNSVPDPDQREPIAYYRNLLENEGSQAYVEWINDYLDVSLTDPQREIIETIHRNQKTLVVAGNGFGKSYVLACFSLAYLFVNYPTSVLATSGTYPKLRRTYCRPIESLHQDSWLPGRYLRSNPPRIVIDSEPEVFWEATSPGDAGELEGVHNEYTLGIVEEADKQNVTEEIFDSLDSLLTDANDKLVAVANPPRDETNVVYDLMDAPDWELRQYSSFQSHNVIAETNHPDPYVRDEDGELVFQQEINYPKLKPELEDEMIPELVRLSQIKQDWEAWNGEEWPGVNEAINSDEREDLDVRWYRRRLGVISPQAADVIRPFSVEDVESAFEAEPANVSATPDGLGWDVVRGGDNSGDQNAVAGVWGRDLRILDWWRGADHLENEEKMRDMLETNWSATCAVDTVGVGSESADRLDVFYPNVRRFNASSNAFDDMQYSNKWTEGLCLLGEYLRDGGSFRSTRLREELLTAARVVELNERYNSRTDTTRFKATSKAKIKKRLGRSPDLLDAMYMAVLMAETGGSSRRTISSSF